SQQLVWASAWPSRAQWNWTLIRPCSSQWISSPAGPVTTAVCWPSTRGLGWRRAGRCGVSRGLAWKWLRERWGKAVCRSAGGAGDDGGRLARHPGFGVAQGGAVRGVPAAGLEVVAVALGEGCFPLSPRGRGLGRGGKLGARRFCAGYGLFQNLGLFAFVVDFGDQPEVVPAVPGVALEFEEVAAAQGRLVAVAGSLAVVAAVAFEAALGQLLAAGAVGEAPGVVVVFQVGQLFGPSLAFQLQAGLLVVVVAAGDTAGAGFQADAEALDHRLIGDHAVALIKAGGRQTREHRLVVGELQVMTLRAVAEVVVDALFLAQTLDEVQVGLVVLGAVVALGIVNTELEAVGIAL